MTAAVEIDEIPIYRTSVADKWGRVAEAGYTVLPYVLLLNQKKLGLTSNDLNVLMNVLAHWHSAVRAPFPHSITIAKRMGASQRTVQRSLTKMKKKGLLKRIQKRHRADPVRYDPRPLRDVLLPFADARIRMGEPTDFERALDEATMRELTPASSVREARDFAELFEKTEGDPEVPF